MHGVQATVRTWFQCSELHMKHYGGVGGLKAHRGHGGCGPWASRPGINTKGLRTLREVLGNGARGQWVRSVVIPASPWASSVFLFTDKATSRPFPYMQSEDIQST